MNTEEVMCIEFTRQSPSSMPLCFSTSSTRFVMFTKPRREGTRTVKYSVWDRILPRSEEGARRQTNLTRRGERDRLAEVLVLALRAWGQVQGRIRVDDAGELVILVDLVRLLLVE